MPCKNQRKAYFLEAAGSIVRQTSPDLGTVDPDRSFEPSLRSPNGRSAYFPTHGSECCHVRESGFRPAP